MNPDDLEQVELFDSGEEEYYHSGHVDGWRYTCAQCGQELTYEDEGEEHYVEDKVRLAQWLMKNCPQENQETGEQKTE